MRKIALSILAMGLLISAACTLEDRDGTQGTIYTTSNLPSAQTEPTAEPTGAFSEVSWMDLGQPIPDVMVDESEKGNSSLSFSEDENHILFYLDDYGLLIIRKDYGTVKRIIKCRSFTYYDGMIYYTCTEENDGNYIYIIMQYDLENSLDKEVIRLDKEILDITCHNGRIFFNTDVTECGLYSCDLSGNDFATHQDENVDTFCVYNNRLFFVSAGDPGVLYEAHPTSQTEPERLRDNGVDSYFNISLGALICYEYKESSFTPSNILIYDINSGHAKELSVFGLRLDLIGQYIIFCEYDKYNQPLFIKAYDFISNKGYTLVDISEIAAPYADMVIWTSKEYIYLCFEHPDKFEVDMYRIVISQSRAVMEHVATITK